jgi:hypothetical protein
MRVWEKKKKKQRTNGFGGQVTPLQDSLPGILLVFTYLVILLFRGRYALTRHREMDVIAAFFLVLLAMG